MLGDGDALHSRCGIVKTSLARLMRQDNMCVKKHFRNMSETGFFELYFQK